MTRFHSCHKTDKNFKSLYGFGGRFLKIRDVCMDFEPDFKVHNLVSVHPKSIILGQMTNLNMIFHVVMSVNRLVKISNTLTRPSSLMNFETAYRASLVIHIASLAVFNFVSRISETILPPRQFYQAFICENVASVGRVKVNPA